MTVSLRKVYLDHTNDIPSDKRTRTARLTRHLMGRMLELREDGGEILGSQDPFMPRDGVVAIDFTTISNAKMASLLEQEYGIATLRPSLASGPVRFSVGPTVTFEDIDYLQGAILQILSRNR